MFDLEQEIRNWRESLESTDAFCNADIVELESHLRDLIEDLTRSGGSLEKAFRMAKETIGSREELAREYAKDNLNPFWSTRTMWLLAGLVILFMAWIPLEVLVWGVASVSNWLEIPLSGLSKTVAALLVLGVLGSLVLLVGHAVLRHGVPEWVRGSRVLIIVSPFLVIASGPAIGYPLSWAYGYASQELLNQAGGLSYYCATSLRLCIPLLLGAFVIRSWRLARTNQARGDARVCWLLTGATIYVSLWALCNLLSWAMLSLYSAAGVSRHPISTIGALVIITSSITFLAWIIERMQRRHVTIARRFWVQLLAVILASLVTLAGAAIPWLVGPIPENDLGLAGLWLFLSRLSPSLLKLAALVLMTICALRLRPQSSVHSQIGS